MLVRFRHVGPLFRGVKVIKIEVLNLLTKTLYLDEYTPEHSVHLKENRAYQCIFYVNGERRGSITIVPMEGREVTVYSSGFTVKIDPVGLVDPRTEVPAFLRK